MALIKCPECGKEISDNAKTAEYAENAKKNNPKKDEE